MLDFNAILGRLIERRFIPYRVRSWAVRYAWTFLGNELGPWTPIKPDRWIHMGYDHEVAARDAIRQVVGTTQLTYERLVTLYEHVVYIERNHLPGALVECGVWRGGAAALMALANLATGEERRPLHLFDSFQGMPEPRLEMDGAAALKWAGRTGDGSLVSTGVNVASIDEVRQLISRIGYPIPYVSIHEGWFQDTLPLARDQIGPIALLRVDADWYESTAVVLSALYDRVVPSGLVVIDDYGEHPGCKRATDEFLAVHEPSAYLHYVDLAARYWIKPMKSA